MKVTLTQYGGLARSAGSGSDVAVGGKPLASQTITAAGNATAFVAGCSLVRVATDAAIDITVGGVTFYVPAGVEFFSANPGDVYAIAVG